MLQNYLKVALRNIFRQKFYSALNILGLAFGLTSSFLIGLYVFDELSFDKFHKDYQNIYHVGMHINFGGQELLSASSCPPIAQAMMDEIPGVEQTTRINPWPVKNLVVKYEGKAFTEKSAFLADSNFFEFFSFRLIEGNVKTALKEPNSVVLTTETANRYFGNGTAIGKTLTLGNKNETYQVTGVAEPAPANSHIQYDLLLSEHFDPSTNKGGWGDYNGMYTYFRKNPATPLREVEIKIKDIVKRNVSPELESAFGVTYDEMEKKGGIWTMFPYALSDSHLFRPELSDGPSPSGDIRYVYMMGAVGVFILLIACINFMNLSTARSAKRAREVGLRKTFGSAQSRLIFQFLIESAVYVFAAAAIAMMATYLLLPFFNMLAGKVLSFNMLLLPGMFSTIVLVVIVVALLAGSYPAFYLTSFKPIDVLKGKLSTGMKSKGIRSALVVFQFSISIALMVCTAVMYSQLDHMKGMDIGLDKHNVIILQNAGRLGKNQKAFLTAVNDQAGVTKASYCSNPFPEVNMAGVFRSAGTTRDLIFPIYNADYDHLDALKIELSQGRYFSREFASDSMTYVLNEAAVRELGWTDPLQGKLVMEQGGDEIRVIGVVRDFNFESFKSKVKPLVIHLRELSDFMHIRYNGNPKDAIASVAAIWKKYAANEPFEYTFLDQSFDELFRDDQRLGKLFMLMSGVAIFVACLGLLGLASFTAEQRTREIGIRKVMGASVTSINSLLSKEFMILVGVAFIAASAFSWFAMERWLDSFAYRVKLEPLIFLLSGVVAAVIAWLTLSYHFIKAARSNPCDAIRHE